MCRYPIDACFDWSLAHFCWIDRNHYSFIQIKIHVTIRWYNICTIGLNVDWSIDDKRRKMKTKMKIESTSKHPYSCTDRNKINHRNQASVVVAGFFSCGQRKNSNTHEHANMYLENIDSSSYSIYIHSLSMIIFRWRSKIEHPIG